MYRETALSKQKMSLVYLWLVPLVTAAIGFGVGPVDYKIYLPFWILNVCLMSICAFRVGVRRLWTRDGSGKQQVAAALLLFLPWLLFSIFAGMGPPPTSVQGWVNTAAEQQTRYTILIAGGIFVFLGTALLKTQLQERGENLYSVMAFAAISIAIPLFIINMAFWGYFLTDTFRLFAVSPVAKYPDWYVLLKNLFYVISVTEVALIYLSTLLFSISLKIVGFHSTLASRWYISFNLIAIIMVLMPPNWPQPFATASYLVAVPAIPFIMYYLIGVRLLKAI